MEKVHEIKCTVVARYFRLIIDIDEDCNYGQGTERLRSPCVSPRYSICRL